MPKKILRVLIYCLLGLITLLFVIVAIFSIRKDEIGRKLLLESNKYTKGELSFESISISPFVQFPSISLSLVETKLYENYAIIRDSLEKPIAAIGELHIGINLIDLLKNKVNVKGIYIENGELNLLQYDDGSLNISRALTIDAKKDTVVVKKTKTNAPAKEKKPVKSASKDTVRKQGATSKPAQKDSSEIKVLLNKISLSDMLINYTSYVDDSKLSVQINSFKASASYLSDSIQCRLKTNMNAGEIILANKIQMRDKDLTLATAFVFNRINNTLRISPSKLDLGEASFRVSGTIGFTGDQLVDLNIDGYDSDMDFSNLFLTQTAVKNIHEGEIYFDGSVKGSMKKNLPEMQFTFGANNLGISMPNSSAKIDHVHLKGFFNSGSSKDFSEASLILDTLTANLPDGYIQASLGIRNFVNPSVSYSCKVKSNIEGFDKVFKLNFIQNLKGSVEFSDSYSGQFIKDVGWEDKSHGTFKIILDSISASIPGALEIDHLDADLMAVSDTLKLRKLVLESGNTTINASGVVYNIYDLVFNKNRKVLADLHIETSQFDLPEALSFNPRIGASFPYSVGINELHVLASTTNNKLRSFNLVPEILFEIELFDGVVNEFLAPFVIEDGRFTLGELKNSLFLDFEKFRINMEGSELLADYQLYSSRKGQDSMLINVYAQNLNPGKILYSNRTDTIPEALNALIDGNFLLKMEPSSIPDILFEKFDLTAEKFSYTSTKDTLDGGSIELKSESIKYNAKLNTNPFATLSAGIEFEAKALHVAGLFLDDFHFSIIANNGEYTMVSDQAQLLGEGGRGKYILKPFANPPEYSLYYTISQFPIKNLFAVLQTESYIEGQANFNMDIQFRGSDKSSILSSLNGNILLSGDDLIFRGVNLDDMIGNFERSQKFNLIDVGAVIVAGPVGLAVTKGSDYARILVNQGDSTHITRINTSISITNGKVDLNDVACATEEQRIAVKGWYQLPSDSLDITVAVLNKKGCSTIEQNVAGHVANPEESRIRILQTILAPVTNLMDAAIDKDCDVFYNGSVPPPTVK